MTTPKRHQAQVAQSPVVRCAIYTRKSTEEGLEQEFNSLMAQREAAEAYILSQRELGWTVVSELYDDGGFSGGSMERPALKRLLDDIAAKRIDCVVVYKVDRLSRSLLDFAAIIGILDRHNATFVSVTQAFNTATSLGRLTLNVLLSFAQFERELTRERTRDKVHAARRKGKWTGGHPVLGYDMGGRGAKLTANEAEAQQVREIFQTFIKTRSLMKTLAEIDQRGWRTKSWVTRKGTTFGGHPMTRHTVEYLLSNPLYIGKVRLKGELHEGEHPAIVDLALWRKANQLLEDNQRAERPKARESIEAILRGLLHCEACGTPMVPAYTKRNAVRVRYYTCLSAQKRGWKTCPSRSLPATVIESAVLERLSLSHDHAQAEVVQSLIERIGYDGRTRQVSIHASEREGDKTDQNLIVFTLPILITASRPRSPGRLPRIARLMALAIRFDSLLRDRTVKDYAHLARLGRVSPARVSQIMNLLNLAPDIQERLLFLSPVRMPRSELSERALRAVLCEPAWARQRHLFAGLLLSVAAVGSA